MVGSGTNRRHVRIFKPWETAAAPQGLSTSDLSRLVAASDTPLHPTFIDGISNGSCGAQNQ